MENICWPESETGYIRIKRKEIKSYITDELCQAVQTWRHIKQYGWPQGKGYLAEPRAVLSIVELFDREKTEYLAWMKNNGGNN